VIILSAVISRLWAEKGRGGGRRGSRFPLPLSHFDRQSYQKFNSLANIALPFLAQILNFIKSHNGLKIKWLTFFNFYNNEIGKKK
jgi:hypothetical protein